MRTVLSEHKPILYKKFRIYNKKCQENTTKFHASPYSQKRIGCALFYTYFA